MKSQLRVCISQPVVNCMMRLVVIPVRLTTCVFHATPIQLSNGFHTAGIRLAYGFLVTPVRRLERFEKRNAMFAASGFHKATDNHNDISLSFYILLSATNVALLSKKWIISSKVIEP